MVNTDDTQGTMAGYGISSPQVTKDKTYAVFID